MKRIFAALIVTAAVCIGSGATPAQDTHATHQELTCFFGSLHAHSADCPFCR